MEMGTGCWESGTETLYSGGWSVRVCAHTREWLCSSLKSDCLHQLLKISTYSNSAFSRLLRMIDEANLKIYLSVDFSELELMYCLLERRWVGRDASCVWGAFVVWFAWLFSTLMLIVGVWDEWNSHFVSRWECQVSLGVQGALLFRIY